ncbi:hypothetical protein HHI36_007668 [Cryptolaemus montrouzieri]|uniref:Uncharacterized protein n=1 Tax=Cryptolaemus montrouzieri TaxID=559131 RepID=A0ABD2MQA4_9CUCU
MRVYEAMVKSSLLYGSETWRLTERFKSRLEAMEMDVLKRSSRTWRREHVTNEVMKREMGVEDNITKDKERKLFWYGHVKRMADYRLAKKFYCGNRIYAGKEEGPNSSGNVSSISQ